MPYPSEPSPIPPEPIAEKLTKPRLTTLQNVSVYIHEDGSVHAFHTRLDTQQYKVISTRLADQEAPDSTNLSAALALIAAACEVYEDNGGSTAYAG